jgi:hypothetical protein
MAPELNVLIAAGFYYLKSAIPAEIPHRPQA